MGMVVGYVPGVNKSDCNVDVASLVTEKELQDGINVAKDYTDGAIQAINVAGGTNHVHANMALLDSLTERNGSLYYKELNLSGVIFETVEG